MAREGYLAIPRQGPHSKAAIWNLVDQMTEACDFPKVDKIFLTSRLEDVSFSCQTEGERALTTLSIPIPVAFYLSDDELECYLYQKLFQMRAKLDLGTSKHTLELYQRFLEIEMHLGKTYGGEVTIRSVLKAFNLHQLWYLYTVESEFYRTLIPTPCQGMEAFMLNAHPYIANVENSHMLIDTMQSADAKNIFVLPFEERLQLSQISHEEIADSVMNSHYSNQFFNLRDPLLHEQLSQLFEMEWKKMANQFTH